MEKVYRVFIDYAMDTEEIARKIIAKLNEKGNILVLLPKPGTEFDMQALMESADCYVPIISDGSINSPSFLYNFGVFSTMAKSDGISIKPIKLTAKDIKELPSCVYKYQWIQLEDTEKSIADAVSFIAFHNPIIW